jgi:hypothetical protein
MNYLIHYNKNHSKANGQFVSGDGDGDGMVNDNVNRRKGVWSAKIENYNKGTMFRDPYYIDKKGNKRSYQSYKEMPVEVQNAEKARAKGKQFVKKVGGTVVGLAGTAAVAAGIIYLKNRLNDKLEIV